MRAQHAFEGEYGAVEDFSILQTCCPARKYFSGLCNTVLASKCLRNLEFVQHILKHLAIPLFLMCAV